MTEALQGIERCFQLFMEHATIVAFMKDNEGRYVWINGTGERLFHLHPSAVIGKTDADLLPAEIAVQFRKNDLLVLESGQSREFTEVIQNEAGEASHWAVNKFIFVNETGERFLGGTAIDITPRVQAIEAHKASEERWQLALRGANDGLWDWNAVTDEVYFSARWKQMLGYSEEEIPNRNQEWEVRVHPEDLPGVQQKLAAHFANETPYYSAEYRMRHRDGSWRWVLARGQAIWDQQGKPLRMAGSHTDITERKQLEEQLAHEAAYDSLTKMPNRRRLLEQVHQHFQKALLFGLPLSICLCDIDFFKQVNDSYGHAAGDRVLTTFAQLIQEDLRSCDFAGRLSGDEFCILFCETSIEDATQRVETLRNRLEHTMFTDRHGNPYSVTATFGVAGMSESAHDGEAIVEMADQALYEGKRLGRNLVNNRYSLNTAPE